MNNVRIFVAVKPNSKRTEVKEIDATHLEISVTAPPKENKANFAVIKELSEYLHVPQSRIRLISGQTSRQKVFEVIG